MIWRETQDGDPRALALYERHYSCRRYRDGRRRRLFVGPGEKMVLLSPCERALFVWRKFRSLDHQRGVNCAVFRNEGAGPGERLYTYVNAALVASPNPGFCFLAAGWQRCGETKRGLLVLEIVP